MPGGQSPLIGVLAVQGAFLKHREKLEALGIKSLEVRTAADLARADALIIPGGESTTMTKVLRAGGLLGPLAAFAASRPVFGTCAGCILLGRETTDRADVQPLGVLDITVERNAYGSQRESFLTTLTLDDEPLEAVFIRAPKILHCGPQVEVLISLDGSPVLVRQGRALAATFHPELSSGDRIHRIFLGMLSA